jgi:superfamily I DNA and/or RNA helicase
LLRTEVTKIVIAGDTHQLPALVSEEGQRLGYDRSLMQRLLENKYPHEFLDVQRRMHPKILEFVNKSYYNNRLKSNYVPATKAVSLPPMSLLNCLGKEQTQGTSFINKDEVDVVVRRALTIKEEFENVIILCPYQGQTR